MQCSDEAVDIEVGKCCIFYAGQILCAAYINASPGCAWLLYRRARMKVHYQLSAFFPAAYDIGIAILVHISQVDTISAGATGINDVSFEADPWRGRGSGLGELTLGNAATGHKKGKNSRRL